MWKQFADGSQQQAAGARSDWSRGVGSPVKVARSLACETVLAPSPVEICGHRWTSSAQWRVSNAKMSLFRPALVNADGVTFDFVILTRKRSRRQPMSIRAAMASNVSASNNAFEARWTPVAANRDPERRGRRVQGRSP